MFVQITERLDLTVLISVMCLDILQVSMFTLDPTEIYSLMLSSIDTTCHSDVLTKDGMFGFCVMSSSALIAFAALTEIEYSSDFRSFIKSVIVFLKFFGVE